MGHQENMEPWYGAKKCQPGLVAHWFSIGQWMKHGTWNWGLLWKWFAGPMNHPLRVDLIGDSDRKWQNRIDICKYSNCKNRYSGASKRDRKETSTKTDDKVLSHASPSIFCSTFHHFLSPFPLAKGVPWTVAWLISWWWIGTSWRGKSSKALSPVWCGFDVENGENDEENIGKLELCHYAVQTWLEWNRDEHRLCQHPKWKEILS